jgi:hypothetical protein
MLSADQQPDLTQASEINVVDEQHESIRPMSVPNEEPEVVEEVPVVEEEAEDKPFYGEKRYEIVDEVLGKIYEQEQMDKISPVQQAALRAQASFLTTSMKNLTPGVDYFGPPKYLS